MAKIKYDPKNARLHNDLNKGQIKKSLEDLGAGRSIVIDNENYIVAGNGVYEQAEQLGIKTKVIETDGTELVVIKRTDLQYDDEKRRGLAIADNATSETSEWDFEELTEDEIEEWGIEEPEEDIEELEATEDDFNEELPEEPITVLGDLYEIGEHRLLCGDSTDSDQVVMLVNGENSELLFTSPPYSDMREYNGEKDLSIDNLIEFIPSWMPFSEYQVVNLGIQRKDNNIVPYWNDYIKKAKECGYYFLSWNIWDRINSGTMAQQTAMFGIVHEWIFVFGKSPKKLNRTLDNKHQDGGIRKKKKVRQSDGTHMETTAMFYDKKQLNTIITCKYETGSIRSLHPATFPVELPSEYIKAMTNENQVISEPFTGSGTTMVAAHQLKRKCYGMELDPKYCDVIVKRMLNTDPKLIIKRNGIECAEDFKTA